MSDEKGIREAPTHITGILKELGPGLIIAGSIVGSGELIATTLTGAEAGFWLMWLILIGCVIKVFAQLEIGRYTITTGETALEGLSKLPGVKPIGVHWTIWLWLIMFIAALGQAGGIVGAVGQSISISVPITEQGRAFNEAADANVRNQIAQVIERTNGESTLETLALVELPETGMDVFYWAFLMTVITCVILYRGRYEMIERFVLVMVGGFTVLSVVNIALLQMNPVWAVSFSEIIDGLSFKLPPPKPGLDPIYTALATFGIIGMAAGELIFYPYWCLEKGYARFVGPRSDRSSWADRARGWMKVMHYDAFVSMVIYTIATLAFFLMGVAVLHRNGLDPDGMRMVSTLSEQYVPVFGDYAKWLFLLGAVAVLYSTFMVATAGHSRMFTDCFKIFGLMDEGNAAAHRRSVSIICVAVPLIAVGIFSTGANPVTLVFIGATMQALMLPLLGFAALYFRYKKTDPRIRPSVLWDVFLVISSLGLFVAGSWLAFDRLWKAFA